MRLDEECVDTLRLRAYLAPLPLREERDAVTRDMQTTIRYEHSLDSAMRPVRPDGMSTTDSRAPQRRGPLLKERHVAATQNFTSHCGVFREDLGRARNRSHTITRPSNSTRMKSYPIKTSACSSRLATNAIFDASPVRVKASKPSVLPFECRKGETETPSAVSPPLSRQPGTWEATHSLLSSRLPREH